ncbi:MAG: TetR/AcrR family transcriptional regulator [Myxococcota bacterium]
MRKSETTRARLLAAAADALLAGGGDFEMGDVARRAGVSSGLPYHHFGSKAGALSAVVEDFYDRYYAVVNQPLDGARPWEEREFERLQSWLAFLYREPLAPVVLGRMGRSVQVAGVESTRQDQLIGLARRNIEGGQQAGDISESIDAGIAAAAIIGAIRQAAIQAFQDPKPPDLGVLTAQLWGLIAGALGLPSRAPFA